MWRSRLQMPIALILNSLSSNASAPLLNSLLSRTLSAAALMQSGIVAPDAERAGVHVLHALFENDPLPAAAVSLIRMRGFMFALIAEDYVLFEPYVVHCFCDVLISCLITVFAICTVLLQCTHHANSILAE